MVSWMLAYSILQLMLNWSPGAILDGLGDLFRWLWGGLLLTGTLMAATGIGLDLVRSVLMRKRPEREQDWLNDSTGLTLESAGMFFSAGALLVYGITILAPMKSSSAFAGGTFIVFGVACLVRSVIIRRDLRRVVRGDLSP